MSTMWKSHAMQLAPMVREHNETQAHLYLEQLMLFPLDIQDMIIEEISHLSHCSSDAIAHILGNYSMMERK